MKKRTELYRRVPNVYRKMTREETAARSRARKRGEWVAPWPPTPCAKDDPNHERDRLRKWREKNREKYLERKRAAQQEKRHKLKEQDPAAYQEQLYQLNLARQGRRKSLKEQFPHIYQEHREQENAASRTRRTALREQDPDAYEDKKAQKRTADTEFRTRHTNLKRCRYCGHYKDPKRFTTNTMRTGGTYKTDKCYDCHNEMRNNKCSQEDIERARPLRCVCGEREFWVDAIDIMTGSTWHICKSCGRKNPTRQTWKRPDGIVFLDWGRIVA